MNVANAEQRKPADAETPSLTRGFGTQVGNPVGGGDTRPVGGN